MLTKAPENVRQFWKYTTFTIAPKALLQIENMPSMKIKLNENKFQDQVLYMGSSEG